MPRLHTLRLRPTILVVSLSFLTLVLRAPRPATADVAIGQLVGNVYDQAGVPLRGVRITVSAEPSGNPQTKTYSDDQGHFVVANLAPGRVSVSAFVPRYLIVKQLHIAITAGQSTEVNFVLSSPTQTEEVRIVEQARPQVSAAHAFVKETYDLDLGSGERAVPPPAATPLAPQPVMGEHNTESYEHLVENSFLDPHDNPLSTFAIDVDTASYANTRRFIEAGITPPAGAVRVEELINYFPYDYPAPKTDTPFATSFEIGACPWNPESRLVRIGLRGRDIPIDQRPPSNLVFLVDVSGSMNDPRKLPLVQESLKLLTGELRPQDRIAIAVYAGASGLVLPSSSAADRQRILKAIDGLEAGGGTNGAAGIELAYRTARQAFLAGGNNRVVLATDGDFNVGVTSEDQLVRLIEEQARSGVFLTVLGFGTGNFKDATMEKLANHGNGNYAYIDSIREAHKVLREQMAGTLLTIAKDVKIQVELNPARVGAYRLIGYEDRLMPKQDFNDDRKDGGEIGAGHTVTALYEVLPPGPAAARALSTAAAPVDPLHYATPGAVTALPSADLMTVKVRYKDPDGQTSRKLEWPLLDQSTTNSGTSPEFRFAAAVAAFGMMLRASPQRGQADLDLVLRLAREGLGRDPGGHRRGFVTLLEQARALHLVGNDPYSDPAGRLVVSQVGRPDISLAVDAQGLHGEVGGQPFEVAVKGVEIDGHLAGEPIWLHMHGREAEGHIGGHDVGFVLTETPAGHLLRGVSVGSTVRLEESFGRLSWLPSCEHALVRLPRGEAKNRVFQGACASGRRMRLVVPQALDDLAPLPRLILLALLLIEPDEPGAHPLFGAPHAEVSP